MVTITPFLWFDDNAEEAVNFYTSIFANSKIEQVVRRGDAGSKGSVMTIAFEVNGQQLIALNGGPHFKFTEAISLVVNCDTQEEVDLYWEKLLSGGGKPSQCGWLKDRFGLSWQVVPKGLPALLGGPDAAKAAKATQAMLKMIKLDIHELRRAYEQG